MDNKEVAVKDNFLDTFIMFSKGKLNWKIETLPKEILETSAEELEKAQKITDTDRKLRLQIHKEFLNAASAGETVQINKICEGVCHPNHFLKLIEDPKKLGWYLLPYQHEQLRIQHQIVRAQDGIEEFLTLPIYRSDGEIDYKAADFKWRAIKLVYDKAYPTVQKIQQLPSGEQSAQKVPDMKNIEDQIKKLEEELGKKKS